MAELTLWAVAEGHLLYPCAISTSGHLHLTLVLVDLAIRTTHWLAVIAAVTITCTTLIVFLLRTVKNVIALAALHKAWRGRVKESLNVKYSM